MEYVFTNITRDYTVVIVHKSTAQLGNAGFEEYAV